MFAIFRRNLFKNWLMILGWGVGLGFLGWFMVDIFDSFFEQNIDFTQYMEAFPEDMLAFFGGSGNLLSPQNFLDIEFFSYIPIILGIMVITNAVRLISKREEEGTLELILAQPVSRSAVFWSNVLALIMSLVLILVLTWGGFAIGLTQVSNFDLTLEEISRPFVSLLVVLLLFLSLSLFLSMILPNSGGAGLASAFLLIVSYFITSLARIEEDLEAVNRFSPLKYYQGGDAIGGLDYKSLLILLGVAILFTCAAWFFFVKRDLRFGGSGGLHLFFPKKREETE
jgi:ABC-2 type transport system permease protein